jgi:DNA-binding PadR family transcriptional regulator
VTESVVLGVLAERPSHGFAVSKILAADGELGRVFTVRRPLVYRALDRLVEAKYAEPLVTEKSEAGPKRTVLRVTPAGRRQNRNWLAEPVEHVRDIRIELLVKLSLLDRSGRSSLQLVRRQREALDAALDALGDVPAARPDHVDLWRHHVAVAARTFLDDLEGRASR